MKNPLMKAADHRKVSPAPRMQEKSVKNNSKDVGIKVKDAANGLSSATELCRKHSERGSYAPMVGGHKMPC